MTDFASIREICGKKTSKHRSLTVERAFFLWTRLFQYLQPFSPVIASFTLIGTTLSTAQRTREITSAFYTFTLFWLKLSEMLKAFSVCLAMEPGEVNQKSGKSVPLPPSPPASQNVKLRFLEFSLPTFQVLGSPKPLSWFFKLIQLIWLRFCVWSSSHST